MHESGQPPLYKLGQEVVLDDDRRPAGVAHTTMYLSRREYDLLRALPGDELTKARHVLEADRVQVCVDVFGGRHDGLCLAEVDVGSTGSTRNTPPLKVVAEVTADQRFTGAALARMTALEVGALLSEFGLDR